MIGYLIAFAAGVAVRQWYAQIWTGIKKIGASVVSKITSKPATPAPKAPAKP